MAVGVRDLKNRTSEILSDLQESGEAVVVTRHGKPAALILPMGSPEADDYILSHAPEIVASLREAEADLRSGKTTTVKSYRRRRGL